MERFSGLFDNRQTMQREAWVGGEFARQWPAAMCASGVDSLMPWERQALELPWGSYPNPPVRATQL